MKTLGIVGGLGPESTVDYYRSIIAGYRESIADKSYPSLIIISLDVAHGIRLLEEKAFPELTTYLADAFDVLARAGADFGLMAANTPHIVFDGVARRSRIPLLSIIDATADAARAAGWTRLALLGTGFTMRGGFYQPAFERAGIQLVVPNQDEQAFIHEKYLGELLNGVFLDPTRSRIIEIIQAITQRDHIQGVILAGTELPLLLRGSDVGVPLLDTAEIHVRAAVARLLA
jgi:aspartate racemase